MDQQIINLYDRFTHGGMSRREFIDRLARARGLGRRGAALLPLLQNDYAQAAIVADNDARLATERRSYDSPKGKINGYLARAKAKGKRPAVIVIHENRGLNPHIEDVARRLRGRRLPRVRARPAVAGRRHAGERGRGARPAYQDEPGRRCRAALAAVSFLETHAESTGKVGAVGFCFGGAWSIGWRSPAPTRAGVAYYGMQPPADKVPTIKAALMLHYAENDDASTRASRPTRRR